MQYYPDTPATGGYSATPLAGEHPSSAYSATPNAHQYSAPPEESHTRSGWDDNSMAYAHQPSTMYAAPSGPVPNASRTNVAAGPGPKQSAYAGVPAAKRRKPKWWLWLLLALLLVAVILGAVLGGVLGSRHHNNKNNSSKPNSSGVGIGSQQQNLKPVFKGPVTTAAAAAAAQGKGDKLAYTGTDVYGNPVYTGDANTGAPSNSGSADSCGADNWKATGNVNNVRPGHPRLMAPQYQWDCLPDRIKNDAYLTAWNATLMHNASASLSAKPVTYAVDGGLDLSGILDVARIVQQRIKWWGYAYRMTGDKKYSARAMTELQTAAGNTSEPFGSNTDRWNPLHFLDTAEMMSAYALAYDWMYDAWTPQERSSIVDWIMTYGLNPGLQLYNQNVWWSTPDNGNGNWNCVSNSGLIVAALAVQGDVQGNNSNVVNQVLSKALPNVKANCMRGVYEDGTWSETPNYWYFGTNAQARLLASLESATGNDQGLMAQNPNWYKTGDFHMYVTGNAGMFAYGDNGPNKFATTANQMFLYARKSNNPRYALFQRDRADASSDPLSMFWYDPSSHGGFWNGLALDQWFNNDLGNWASMRSSWTDMSGTYVAMKASNGTGHQTHGDLDAGDFVIDALGTRWAGEYGSDNYLSKNYFSNESDTSSRWTYFRKGTQGQNTLVIGNTNQVASCKPVNNFQTTNAKQGDGLDYTPGKGDVAFFTTDLSSCYSAAANQIRRGIRFLNGRRQILVQDEVAAQNKPVQWRVQTNATVALSGDKRTATLTITKVDNPNAGVSGTAQLPNAVKMVVTIAQPATATFAVNPAVNTQSNKPNYLYGENSVPPQDTIQDANTVQQKGSTIQAEILDPEVNVLSIDLPSQQDTNLQVVWQPQYPSMQDSDKALPKNVALNDWTLTSH